jgi:NTP pyrophosphatase (non-canonical NTP hydrolase)
MDKTQLYERLRKANGSKHQLNVAVEELAELTKEITKMNRGKGSVSKLIEEIADVEIMLEQIMEMYPHYQLKDSIKEYKLRRLELMFDFYAKEAGT